MGWELYKHKSNSWSEQKKKPTTLSVGTNNLSIPVATKHTGEHGDTAVPMTPYMGAGFESGCATSDPAPCLWLRKALKDGSGPWAPAYNTGDSAEALAVAAIWRVNQQMEYLCLALSQDNLS